MPTLPSPRQLFAIIPLHLLNWTLKQRWSMTSNLLIKLGADVNGKFADGTPILYEAILRHDLNAVKILIAAGADVNLPNASNISPIELEIGLLCNDLKDNYCDSRISALLIAAGADAKKIDVHAKLPLFFKAIVNKLSNVVAYWLNKDHSLATTSQLVDNLELTPLQFMVHSYIDCKAISNMLVRALVSLDEHLIDSIRPQPNDFSPGDHKNGLIQYTIFTKNIRSNASDDTDSIDTNEVYELDLDTLSDPEYDLFENYEKNPLIKKQHTQKNTHG